MPIAVWGGVASVVGALRSGQGAWDMADVVAARRSVSSAQQVADAVVGLCSGSNGRMPTGGSAAPSGVVAGGALVRLHVVARQAQ